MVAALYALALIALAGPDGQVIWIAPEKVISVREPRGVGTGHWPPGTRCLVMTTDGKFVTTVENCSDIRRKLENPP